MCVDAFDDKRVPWHAHTIKQTHTHTLFLYERHCETLQDALVHGGTRACY